MYSFARQWRILSTFTCFAMEGSQRNGGGLSLLQGRLGMQVVMDDHTIDDILRREGYSSRVNAASSVPGIAPAKS